MPHPAWEQRTNENTNGLIRQYLPKRINMARLTQHDCNVISIKLTPDRSSAWTTEHHRSVSMPTKKC